MHRNEYRRMAHEEVEEIFRDHTLPSNAFQPVWKQDCIM